MPVFYGGLIQGASARRFSVDGSINLFKPAAFSIDTEGGSFSSATESFTMPEETNTPLHLLQECDQLIRKAEAFLYVLVAEDEVIFKTYELLRQLVKELKNKHHLLKVALSEA